MLGHHGDDVVEDIPSSVQITGLWNYVLLYMPEGHSGQQQGAKNKILDTQNTRFKINIKDVLNMWCSNIPTL